MTNYNQNIGDLFTITFCSSWPMCNATGQFVRNVKNNEIVMLLEYRPPPHVIPSYSSNSQGIAKVLCAEGCVGYVPTKFLKIIRKEKQYENQSICLT
jgi:hypothetical protein